MMQLLIDFVFKKKIVFLIFIIGFIYIALPGPKNIDSFTGLNPSVKSDLPGDTWQNPNISAYFSDYRRDEITKYYRDFFGKQLLFGILLPVIKINHPPERAYQYVRDQQESTFLEEYVFPMRESIFVNGYEPFVQGQMRGKAPNFLGDHVIYKDVFYNSKTTLRYYPSNIYFRIVVYLCIWMSVYELYSLSKKIIKE